MFKKILIANRGEIAVRIIKTCRELGIKTVGVYSKADKDTLHVNLADEAYYIGESRVSESYLNIERIIEVAKQAGAEAIHPGYGLLSENAEFANACGIAGITFIGPSPEVIQKMGNKIQARKLMVESGIPIVPGTRRPLKNSEEAVEVAREIGYPIMLKASAGGGGIGIEVIHNEDELKQKFTNNQKRSENFFASGEMYLEKYIINPRHIEVQILADKYGNTIHLWERDCSTQRHHQKVLEEAPATCLSSETRGKLVNTAIKAAKSLAYTNAGTIEFLVSESQEIFFLEMNTRLQVEHPITEEITGVDLVEEQIRIAIGQKLRHRQEDIQCDGHAIEVRIYAEDPVTFFPSPGTISNISFPQGENIRHELAIREGSIITPFYDPMIGKMIVKGADRQEAISSLKKALEEYVIEGIKTNIPTLMEISSHPKFDNGEITTNFLTTEFKSLLKSNGR
ncbi:acetyl-CoA carboxylase biotin carboxylase subunit [Oceanobacillus alkalisoli]|uniref:acetyl-CoA carboxylase biotin carboxylase subunit n=1 Tax=Oceanobacillus alkalisoli TaxID=2925113 RepID=UPI001EE3F4CF|nr:acetyl-CoA carboxylase biotin carboxylase subunit [Oceanobacillus alkalisoli]MCG5103224.1 acetyl-CoA carboxylase biotin carboxylase subunit [Oceanobacillus alkalisoli]